MAPTGESSGGVGALVPAPPFLRVSALGSEAKNSGGSGAEPPEDLQFSADRGGLWDEKQQLPKRIPPAYLLRTLEQFNTGEIPVAEACMRLDLGKSRFYELRTRWLRERKDFAPTPSGGDQRGEWGEAAHAFLKTFLPCLAPPNYQLVADELERLCGVKRRRSTVERYVKAHFARLVPAVVRKPRSYRRFRAAHVGALWQHDSCIHPWLSGGEKQLLLLTVDDHSRKIVAARFVDGETTWNHFCHFRSVFETLGLPQAIYTDGLSLFGAESCGLDLDPRSEFQRALNGLQVVHLVAPTPQAKGKVERRFGTLQKRLVTLLAHEKIFALPGANEVLDMEVARSNRTVCRTTGEVPDEVWAAQTELMRSGMRPPPAVSLMDLHLSFRQRRRVNADGTVDFLGQNWEIGPTHHKRVTILHCPERKFWVVDQMPKATWPSVLGSYDL